MSKQDTFWKFGWKVVHGDKFPKFVGPRFSFHQILKIVPKGYLSQTVIWPRQKLMKYLLFPPQPSVFSRQSRHPSVSREARVGRSGDSARECRVAVLLATSGAGRAITICREKRRARRQWRELTPCFISKLASLVSSPSKNSPSKREIIREIEQPIDGLNLQKNCTFEGIETLLRKKLSRFLPTALPIQNHETGFCLLLWK